MKRWDWRLNSAFMNVQKKIKTEAQLLRTVRLYRQQGKTIVTYNGSFDVLHLGHILSIQEAKRQGDVLVLLVNSDASVQSYKGPNRPIVPEVERVQMLAALADVDLVCLFAEVNPKRILGQIKPDVHCNGADWGRDCIEKGVVEAGGGQIHLLRWHKGKSTTDVVKKIQNLQEGAEVRAVFLDRDGTINENGDGYTHKKENFIFTSGAVSALRALSKTDYKIIVVTNQSGIGRGYFSERQVVMLHNWFKKECAKKKIRIDAIYYCPHHPSEGCECRKPKSGMLLRAVTEFGVRLDKSWMVGDSQADIEAGKDVNVPTIKVGAKIKDPSYQPKVYVKSLREAVDVILHSS